MSCSLAIAPPILVEPFDTKPSLSSVYTSDDDQKTYLVEIWNEFSVLCVSFGEFSGHVTWNKTGSEGI